MSHPLRIVLDTTLRIPLSSTVVQTAASIPTLIATSCSDSDRIAALEDKGCHVLITKKSNSHVDLDDLMEKLGDLSVDSVYVEGGSSVHASLFEAGLVNALHVYVAPKVFGGTNASGPVGGSGVAVPDEAFMMRISTVERLGDDLFIECEVS